MEVNTCWATKGHGYRVQRSLTPGQLHTGHATTASSMVNGILNNLTALTSQHGSLPCLKVN
eukprot:4797194-Prymnesium_polylepis.1